MNDDDEYSLHYEFSDKVTEADRISVKSLTDNIMQRGNPFDLEQCQEIMNIATGAILEQEEKNFLLNFDTLGKDARKDFYRTRLQEKTKNLIGDTIPMTRKKTKKKENVKTYDLNKETVKLLRHIDYARVRGFDLNFTYIILPHKGWSDAETR